MGLTRPSPVELSWLNEGHRKNAYINVHRKVDGGFENLASLPAHDNLLPGMIEAVASALDVDSFASINSYHRPGHAYAKSPAFRKLIDPTTGKPIRVPLTNSQRRLSDQLARLNACWVDVDCYSAGLDEGHVVGLIWQAQRQAKIPPPTFYKGSGRGIWAYWLLDGSNRAWPEEIALWEDIQRHLVNMFAAIGADHNAKARTTISRVAGSINSKVDKRVDITAVQYAPNGKPYRYSLAQLAAALGVEPSARHYRRTRRLNADVPMLNKAKGAKGTFARWKLDEDRFWTLCETIRQAVPEGTRHNHCFIIGCILRHRYRDDQQRQDEVHKAAERLWALMPDDSHLKTERRFPRKSVDVEIASTAHGPKYKVKATEIANRLQVTTDEAQQLAEMFNRPTSKSWPPADGQAAIPEAANRPQLTALRRQWIRDQGRSVVWAMTCKDLALAIEAAGYRCSGPTARTDREAVFPKSSAQLTFE